MSPGTHATHKIINYALWREHRATYVNRQSVLRPSSRASTLDWSLRLTPDGNRRVRNCFDVRATRLKRTEDDLCSSTCVPNLVNVIKWWWLLICCVLAKTKTCKTRILLFAWREGISNYQIKIVGVIEQTFTLFFCCVSRSMRISSVVIYIILLHCLQKYICQYLGNYRVFVVLELSQIWILEALFYVLYSQLYSQVYATLLGAAVSTVFVSPPSPLEKNCYTILKIILI